MEKTEKNPSSPEEQKVQVPILKASPYEADSQTKNSPIRRVDSKALIKEETVTQSVPKKEGSD